MHKSYLKNYLDLQSTKYTWNFSDKKMWLFNKFSHRYLLDNQKYRMKLCKIVFTQIANYISML